MSITKEPKGKKVGNQRMIGWLLYRLDSHSHCQAARQCKCVGGVMTKTYPIPYRSPALTGYFRSVIVTKQLAKTHFNESINHINIECNYMN